MSWLGEALLGIGSGESAAPEEAWWKRVEDEDDEEPVSAAPMTLGRQGRLFETAGEGEVAGAAGLALGETTVSVRKKDARTARVVATTGRAAAAGVGVSSGSVVRAVGRAGVAEGAAKSKGRRMVGRLDTAMTKGKAEAGDMIRGLEMSQSISVTISSGQEARRRYSVPRRLLLPRYQLHTGYEGVEDDGHGGMRLGRGGSGGRGRVLFG